MGRQDDVCRYHYPIWQEQHVDVGRAPHPWFASQVPSRPMDWLSFTPWNLNVYRSRLPSYRCEQSLLSLQFPGSSGITSLMLFLWVLFPELSGTRAHTSGPGTKTIIYIRNSLPAFMPIHCVGKIWTTGTTGWLSREGARLASSPLHEKNAEPQMKSWRHCLFRGST